MKYLITQSNGRSVQCENWDSVLNNITVYVSPSDKVQAKAMLDAGCATWDFVYGFSHDRVSKLDPVNSAEIKAWLANE